MGSSVEYLSKSWSLDHLVLIIGGRSLYVVVNGVSSDIIAINCGVPHRSFLVPALFILHVNLQMIVLSILHRTPNPHQETKNLRQVNVVNDDLAEITALETKMKYCSHIWGSAPKLTLMLLDHIQRRAIRLVGEAEAILTNNMTSL
ncbi:unnamed protein product [Phaedon cochleariae]|uniref:Uncharacterized protein n=1 Tax=Phaedon cochleariae TaxID=80249 RepID=A0A9N9S871_PHACE|nr:unnamed protein product [Phaedon cochleariae]